ncbi:Alpha-amylase Aah4 [Schizosaccharomyces pombe]
MKLSLKDLALSIILVLGVAPPVQALSAEEWKKQSVYNVMTDRFATSKVVPHCDVKAEKYCGGNWQGIVDHLDYIRDLGFTAISISPVVEQLEGPEYHGEAYHGHRPKNYYRLNPHFGNEEDLKELSDALHGKGMYLMVDVAINHTISEYFEDDYFKNTYFDKTHIDHKCKEHCSCHHDKFPRPVPHNGTKPNHKPWKHEEHCHHDKFPRPVPHNGTKPDHKPGKHEEHCHHGKFPRPVPHNGTKPDHKPWKHEEHCSCHHDKFPRPVPHNGTKPDHKPWKHEEHCHHGKFPRPVPHNGTKHEEHCHHSKFLRPVPHNVTKPDHKPWKHEEHCHHGKFPRPVPHNGTKPDHKPWKHEEHCSCHEDHSIHERPSAKGALEDYIQTFVETFQIDGIRFDAMGDKYRKYWPDFCKAAGVFCMGDLKSSDSLKVCDWQNDLEGLSNFPVRESAVKAFLMNNPEGIVDLADKMTDMRGLCVNPLLLGNFVENKDLPRMASISSDPATLKNAIAFVLMGDGIPMMYNGQELAMRGEEVPYNRPAIWEKGFPKRNPYYKFTSAINRFRKAMIESKDGEAFLNMQSDISIVDKRLLLLRRGKVITVLNNLGSYYIHFHYTVSAEEHKWMDVLSCKSVPVQDNRQVFMVRNGEPMILYPEESAYEMGLCPSPIQLTEDYNSEGSLSINVEEAQTSKAPEQNRGFTNVLAALLLSLLMIL